LSGYGTFVFVRKILGLSYLFLLAACAVVTPTAEHTSLGIDGVACVGEVERVPESLVAVQDSALLETALGASGEGKLCQGKVFLTTQAVTVYRVWNSDKSYSLYGRWWSFQPPEGSRQKYRKDNVICPSWSALDRMSECTIKVGTRIVVGPGQSAACRQTTYAKSAVNQVFIQNDSRNDVILVENCSAGVDWP
jgi:hypothetical protein